MKFKVKKDELLNSLQIISRAIDPRATLPVLGNILMEVNADNLILKATNLEITIRSEQKVEVESEGVFTVPAKLFIGYVNLIQDEDIEIEERENLTLFIKTHSSETEIKGLSAEDFPVFPIFKEEKSFQIPAGQLSDCISETVFASSWDSTRPVLNGVLFDKDKKILKIATTDSYRLAEKTVELLDKTSNSIKFLLPNKSALDLMAIFSKSEEFCQIAVNKNQILFKTSQIEFSSRLQEGNFPEYTPILPTEFKTRAKVSVSDLNISLKKASLFTDDTSRNIRISLANNQILIKTNQTEFGKDEITIPCQLEGEDNEIALNAGYLVEALAVFKDQEVYFEMVDKTKPGVLKPVDRDDYIYIVMPLKI